MASLQKPLSLEALLEFGKSTSILSPGTFGLVVVLALWTLCKQTTQAQVPKIVKIPEAPDALPFKLKNDLFQMRLGSERAVVANTFATIKGLWVGHSNDLIDKPQQHAFAELLEYDLPGTNMTEPIRRCRKAATRVLSKPLWPTYYHLLEPSSVRLTKELLQKGRSHLDIYPYLRQIVFDLALSLTHGYVSTGLDDEFTDALVASINQISYFRASTQRFRDYVPMLRFLVTSFASRNLVASAEKERQKRLDVVYAALKKRTAAGEQVDCIVNGLVKDNLSEGEIHGTCKALLQAAPDSTASSVYLVIGWFSTPEGQEFQDVLYAEILNTYDGDRDKAWDMAFREESVELLVSLFKETLRLWTTTPFAVQRMTVKDVAYAGTIIPQGTTMIMNAQQANHDEVWYGNDAKTFKPARFVGNTTSLPHLTFGVGARICPAAALSNRIIYALVMRLVLAFKIQEEGKGARKANTDMLDFSDELGRDTEEI
ncbi:uncharacterized protein PAC_13965 [Phialocephala subalpina]|uniref:Cytochrome P450 n=1 Tax=Phialocephala subalpina TaxID=576137 RepID=A0A1L7XGD5_9HELO|nr:uncharacterized protein PAC_13965 [Phialocephala subalpina]